MLLRKTQKLHNYCFAGIKFLWWTWHDTDAPIRVRILGVPVGSSVWVVTFTGIDAIALSTYLCLV